MKRDFLTKILKIFLFIFFIFFLFFSFKQLNPKTEEQERDKMFVILEKSFGEIKNSLDEVQAFIKSIRNTNNQSLTNEELIKLKEKILQYENEKESRKSEEIRSE